MMALIKYFRSCVFINSQISILISILALTDWKVCMSMKGYHKKKSTFIKDQFMENTYLPGLYNKYHLAISIEPRNRYENF